MLDTNEKKLLSDIETWTSDIGASRDIYRFYPGNFQYFVDKLTDAYKQYIAFLVLGK